MTDRDFDNPEIRLLARVRSPEGAGRRRRTMTTPMTPQELAAEDAELLNAQSRGWNYDGSLLPGKPAQRARKLANTIRERRGWAKHR